MTSTKVNLEFLIGPMRINSLKFLLLITLTLSLNFSFAQTTIWSVDFETGYSDNDETAQDNNSPTGADWTKSGSPTNWWRVETNNAISGSFCMNGRNTDGVMTWTSESIDISNYSDVSISIDIGEQNCESTDIIETFYDIGSGNVEFGNGNGNGNFGSATNTITSLNASSLTIVVTLNNNGGNERLFFDNIVVSGTLNNGHLGPGGVGNIDGTGSLEVWLRADDLDGDNDLTDNPADGSSVSTWADYSGNSNDYTNTGSNRPTYSSSGSFMAVNFDAGAASAQYLNGASSGSYSDASAFFVTNAADAGNNSLLFDNGTYSLRVEQWANSGVAGFTRYGVADYTTSISSVFGSDAIYSFHKNGSSSNVDIRVDNNSETLAVGTSAAGIPYDRIGQNSITNDEASGDIMEVILFSEELNDAQINIIDNYLSAKYGGISINSDLYDEDDVANGNHDFDVAGIGQAADGSNHTDAQGTGLLRVNTPSDLDNSEYLIWGHDNGDMSSSGVTDLPSGVESRLARNWKFSETGDVGTVTISLDLSDFAGSITTSDLRLLIDSDGDGSYNDESGGSIISGAVNTSGSIYEWTGVSISNNQGLSLGSVDESNTPLPISLLSFNASYIKSNFIEVEWSTSSELNNQYFQVEKSQNGSDWFLVTEIDGAGNSNQELNYTIIDKDPFSGTSYYRLRQIDFDGKTELFDPVAVQTPFTLHENLQESVSLYPNPGNGSAIYLELTNFKPDTYQINVMTERGEFVLNREAYIEDGVISHELELLHGINLSSGVYFIRVSSLEKVVTKKYIVY